MTPDTSFFSRLRYKLPRAWKSHNINSDNSLAWSSARIDGGAAMKRSTSLSLACWIGMFLLYLLGASVLMAQMPTATILGFVRDPSGAVVPQANLTARNMETGQTRTSVSADDGSYRFSALPIGKYEVRSEKTGFETDVHSGLTLNVGDEAVVNFELKVGGVEQVTVVTGEAPLVNTTSGSLGSLVNEQKVEDLPLNGRNYIDLTLLQPGVTQHREIGANPTNVGLWYSSNGAPVRSNNLLLDGASLSSFLGANSASASGATLGLDGIREYRVITNAFSAEYGMTMGSQVVMVSKGGTNKWSGDVFEYLRNSVMDARNFFDALDINNANGKGTDKSLPYPGKRLPPFQRNNFGGAFGGPIQKDKTFFYAVYEGLRQRQGQTIIDPMIPAACHQNLVSNGTTGYNFDTLAHAQACVSTLTTASLIPNPIYTLLTTVYPLPNLPGNQFTYPYVGQTRDDYGQIRVDHVFSANDSLFARYTIDDAQVISAIQTPAGYQSYPGYLQISLSRGQFATLAEDHIFSQSLLNSARFSFSRTAPRFDSHVPYVGSQYGMVSANSNELGNINIAGVAGLGPNVTSPAYLPQNAFTWSDDLFYTRGKHSLKFGTLINRFQLLDSTARGLRGTATFASIANFMQGTLQNFAELTPGSNLARSYRYTTLGFYGQDDYRVSSRLTLNLGLRYEFMNQLHERYGIQASVVNLATDSGPTVGVPFKNPTLHNVSPRFGFAWDIMGDGKTALRGGFAELYDLSTYGTGMNVIQPNAQPFSSGSTAQGGAFAIPYVMPLASVANTLALFNYNMRQPHILSYNLTLERQLPFGIALSVAYAGSRGIDLLGTRDGNPRIPGGVPVNGVCQPLPTGQTANLTSMVDGSATACWAPTVAGVNPNSFYNPKIPFSNSMVTAPASSNYNALQFGLTKRLSRGLQFQSSYTWSKLLDNTQAEATQVVSSSPVQPTDAFHSWTDYGPSVFDVTQNWRFNTIYQMPQLSRKTGFLPQVVNGWQMSGILTLETGYPFTVNLQANRSASGAFSSLANLDRPDLARGRDIYSITHGFSTASNTSVNPAYTCPTAGQPLGTPSLWYDPCAFVIPTAGFLGNTGRNILRGPGLTNLDFSLVKNTAVHQLGENGNLEFRAEFFNILNHPNFDIPARTVYAGTANAQGPVATAGQITTTLGTVSRQIQLALKVAF